MPGYTSFFNFLLQKSSPAVCGQLQVISLHKRLTHPKKIYFGTVALHKNFKTMSSIKMINMVITLYSKNVIFLQLIFFPAVKGAIS